MNDVDLEGRRIEEQPKRRQNVFVCLPSYRGIQPTTFWNIFDWRTELETAGHRLHGSSPGRMILDLARNELATVFLSTTAEIAALIDDDVEVDRTWIVRLVESGLEVITVPCRMRSEGHLFNVVPTSSPYEAGGLRVVDCAWTGLGCVLVRRSVFERLAEVARAASRDKCAHCGHAPEPRHYRSLLYPERTSSNLFGSHVVPAGIHDVSRPVDENAYFLDDRVFSGHLHDAGFKIRAAIDVPTVHDGMRGCFSEELEKVERLQRQAAQNTYGKPNLVGPNGERL